MKLQYTISSIIFSILICSSLSAQIDGDNLFSEDQIVNIELNFSQVGFWDSLELNYATSTYMRADLVLTDVTGTYSFADVGVRLKGNSSYGHPGDKKSFKIDFNKYVSGQDYDGIKKLNFSNCFKDPSMLREKVFFDFCRIANVPAPRANFATVTLNGTAWGFYTLIEQIDDQFLDWRILDDDGNLFKAGSNFGNGPGGGGDEADLQHYGSDIIEYQDRYELKSNEDENDWSDLMAFTDFVDNSNLTTFENEIDQHLQLDEYLRTAAIDNLFSNLDSYTESARNYYIYHNLTSDKWEWIKWDGNESFGLYRAGQGINVSTLPVDYHSNNRPLLEKVMDSPSLYYLYQVAMCDLVDQYFNVAYMHPKIDQLKLMIQDAVYADNNKQYTNANFDANVEDDTSLGGGGGPGGGNVLGLKSFIQEKSAFIQTQIDCASLSTTIVVDHSVSVYPNPTKDILNLDWDAESISHLEIYNYLGERIFQSNTNGIKQFKLDLSHFESGQYFVLLQKTDGKLNQKIVKRFVKI